LTLSNQDLAPEKFKNLELGWKWDTQNNWSVNAAIYQLDRSNVLITDPSDVTKSILVDGQTAKGFELGIDAKLLENLRLTAGYAYQDAKITRAQSATVKAGAIVAQVPKHSASVWARYEINPAFGLGLGAVTRSAIYPSTDNLVVVPGFARYDAAVYYAMSKDVHVQLNIENLVNRQYYSLANSNNNIMPGSPRAARVSVHLKF